MSAFDPWATDVTFDPETDVSSESAASKAQFEGVGVQSTETSTPGWLDDFQKIGLNAVNAGTSALVVGGVAAAVGSGPSNPTASLLARVPTASSLANTLAGYTAPFAASLKQMLTGSLMTVLLVVVAVVVVAVLLFRK
jgi:hypothetical protein